MVAWHGKGWVTDKLEAQRKEKGKRDTLAQFEQIKELVLPRGGEGRGGGSSSTSAESKSKFNRAYALPFFTNFCFDEAKERYQQCLKPLLYKLVRPEGDIGWRYSPAFNKFKEYLFETQADQARKGLSIAARDFAVSCSNATDEAAAVKTVAKYVNDLLWWQDQFTLQANTYIKRGAEDLKAHPEIWHGMREPKKQEHLSANASRATSTRAKHLSVAQKIDRIALALNGCSNDLWRPIKDCCICSYICRSSSRACPNLPFS